MLKGFKNFLMNGNVVVFAVGLVVATAFSTLIKGFTDNIITPIVSSFTGGKSAGFGFMIRSGKASTFVNVGGFISIVIYFIIYMAVIYFVIVVPYRHIQARRGISVFGDPDPVKSCPECLADDLPMGATKCRYCASQLPAAA